MMRTAALTCFLVLTAACGGDPSGPTEDTALSGSGGTEPSSTGTDGGGSTSGGSEESSSSSGGSSSDGTSGSGSSSDGTSGPGSSSGGTSGSGSSSDGTSGSTSGGGTGGIGGSTGDDFGECGPDADCPAGYFCKYHVGICGDTQKGECLPEIVGCPLIYAPVCACDGKTYGSECMASAAGYDVDYQGECMP